MRIFAALNGSLREQMEAELAAAEQAVTQSIREAVEGAKNDMRRETVTGGLGARLAKAWRGEVYPKNESSMNAAGIVWTKAPKLMAAFGANTAIKAGGGRRLLAIPTENAPKKGIGGKRISPSNWPDNRFGRLRFVDPGDGKNPFLVADGLRARKGKRGGFTRASAAAVRRGDVQDAVVMFTLVPQVRLRKRVDFEAVAKKWGDRLPNRIVDRWKAARR